MMLKIKKGLIVQKKDRKTIIFDAERSVLYTLNDTGSFILSKIKKGLEEKQIIDAMINEYKIKEEVAKSDFKELLEKLFSKKIVLRH